MRIKRRYFSLYIQGIEFISQNRPVCFPAEHTILYLADQIDQDEVCSNQNFPFRLEEIRFLCISTTCMFEQSSTYLKQWAGFFVALNLDISRVRIKAGKKVIIKGLGYSAINRTCSVPFTILPSKKGVKFGRHPIVTSRLKGIFIFTYMKLESFKTAHINPLSVNRTKWLNTLKQLKD